MNTGSMIVIEQFNNIQKLHQLIGELNALTTNPKDKKAIHPIVLALHTVAVDIATGHHDIMKMWSGQSVK